MTSSKKVGYLVVVLGLLVPLAAAANGNGSGDSGTCIASMSASLESAVLISGSTEVTVISSPTPILLVGDEDDLKGVVSVTIPADSPVTSFDHVRITLSGISFSTFADCVTGSLPGNPDTLTDLVIEFEEDDEDDDTEEITPGQPVSLELKFEPEDGLMPDGAGCFTGNFVADPAPAFEAEIEDDENEEEDLELSGSVVSVGSSDFVLDVNGTQYTITVDSNTEFEDPLTGLSGLAAGDLVKAEVDTQPDGTLLATEVELLFDESEDNGSTGRIACVDSSSGPAGSITLVFAPSNPDHAFPALTLTVNLSGSTNFRVNRGNINTSGFTFDASNLSPGQRITAAGSTVSGSAPEVDASNLILKLQQVDGMLVAGSVNTTARTFELRITSASDVLLTEPVLVQTSVNTRFAGKIRDLSGLNTTDTYQIKGLLMKNSANGTVTFLAKKIKRKTGNAP